MAVPVQTLRQASRPLPERIYEFLARAPSDGFPLLEIVPGVEELEARTFALVYLVSSSDQRQQLVRPYLDALADLERQGRVTRFVYRGIDHYAASVHEP